MVIWTEQKYDWAIVKTVGGVLHSYEQMACEWGRDTIHISYLYRPHDMQCLEHRVIDMYEYLHVMMIQTLVYGAFIQTGIYNYGNIDTSVS